MGLPMLKYRHAILLPEQSFFLRQTDFLTDPYRTTIGPNLVVLILIFKQNIMAIHCSNQQG